MTDLDVNFLLDDFVARVPKVTHVVAVAADGLLVARNQTLPQDQAERLAAIGSGLASLLHGAAHNLQAGPVVSNMTELAGGFMFTMSVTNGSVLALAAPGCDIGQVGHDLAELVNRVGPALTPQIRTGLLNAPGPVG